MAEASKRPRITELLTDRKLAQMTLLGFSAGIPYLLVFSTLTAWLRTDGVSRATIGYFTWIGTLYAIKFLWSPVVDRFRLPLLTRRLGQRRSWMLIAQLTIGGGLIGMSMLQPSQHLTAIALLAVTVAFGAATQDVALDALRIDMAGKRKQAALASVYVLGYRIALIVTGAGALFIADAFSWHASYMTMGALMTLGIVATLWCDEPERAAPEQILEQEQAIRSVLGNSDGNALIDKLPPHFVGAVICPLVDFFQRYGKHSLVILGLICTFRIADISMGAMANPLYIDLGFSLTEIAEISKVFGIVVTLIGGFIAGALLVRLRLMTLMLAGAILVAVTNLLFAWLSTVGHSNAALIVTIAGDNFANGFASVILIAYMSSLVNQNYTATQYALFSSLMNLPAKFIGGFSGEVADVMGWFYYFIYVGALGVPAIVLVLILMALGHAPDTGDDENSADPSAPDG